MSGNSTSMPSRTSLADLTLEHYSALERSMSNVLSTRLASDTFAQIVDGLPTANDYKEYYGRWRDDFDRNLEPSQEARRAVENSRESFNIRNFSIDSKTAQLYQNCPAGSREFTLRLIEIVAVLCHNIAVYLYTKYDGGIRKPDLVYARQTPSPELSDGYRPPTATPLPAVFFHGAYRYWEQYPNGVADIVGYWAEYRLFGGVVLFDRGESRTDCKDLFIHPVGRHQIFQVSEAQIQQFAVVVLGMTGQLQNGDQAQDLSKFLRFKAEKYARRVHPYDAMSLHIYRDKYERRLPDARPVECVVRGEDIPEFMDAFDDLVKQVEERRRDGEVE